LPAIRADDLLPRLDQVEPAQAAARPEEAASDHAHDGRAAAGQSIFFYHAAVGGIKTLERNSILSPLPDRLLAAAL
jgi:hypothetical protein